MEETQVNKTESTIPNEKIAEKAPSPVEDKVKESEPEIHIKKTREEKLRKRDDKTVEQVLKALSTLGSSEEKLAAMCKKYTEMVEENRKLQLQIKQYDKRVIALQREKEQLQNEQSKTIITRSRLESLCRELQKQNKQIKEESLQRVKDEEEKRKAVSGKFQSTLSEITALMQQNNENNSKLREENLEMQNKFKTVCEQYELREQQVEKMSKQMQLESQLAEAKLTKLKIEMIAEKELLENEKKQLLIELAAYQHRCQEMQKNEVALNNQLSMYTEKYDKFQDALAKSNQLYGGFKGEMEKMSKKITKLEKETTVWKMRWENNHKALLQVAAEKQQKASELTLAAKQLNQLQQLCRTLQADRRALMLQLKSEGITPKLSEKSDSESTTNESESESKSETKPEEESPSQVVPVSEIFENGTEHVGDEEGTSLPEEGAGESGKLDKPEEVCLIPAEDGDGKEASPPNDEKGIGEVSGGGGKPEPNSKTKKGKEASKKRKK